MTRETQRALANMAATAARATGATSASATACPSLFERENMYDETPLAVVEFSFFPSVNDALFAYNAGRHSARSFNEKWQAKGRDAVAHLARMRDLKTEIIQHPRLDKEGNVKEYEARERLVRVLFDVPVEIVLRVWRPTAAAYDVHNPYVKPVFDGFTHAQLWRDDSVKYVCDVRMRHEGVDRTLRMPESTQFTRQRTNEARRARKKSPVRFPMFGRFRFEFYARP
jgi:Holliday junction resolvase RusA-like endonuclease